MNQRANTLMRGLRGTTQDLRAAFIADDAAAIQYLLNDLDGLSAALRELADAEWPESQAS